MKDDKGTTLGERLQLRHDELKRLTLEPGEGWKLFGDFIAEEISAEIEKRITKKLGEVEVYGKVFDER